MAMPGISLADIQQLLLGIPPKWIKARDLIKRNPQAWFRRTPMFARDRRLLSGESSQLFRFGTNSYVRKIYHGEVPIADRKTGDPPFYSLDWTVEGDLACKKMVVNAGGCLIGFDADRDISASASPNKDLPVRVNVNVVGTPLSGFYGDWGFLSTHPSNIRLFKGPRSTCQDHPWDAMILRDCIASSDNLWKIERVGSRKWDILAMKMCEDHDFPWIVMAITDAGENPEDLGKCTLGVGVCPIHSRNDGDDDETAQDKGAARGSAGKEELERRHIKAKNASVETDGTAAKTHTADSKNA